MVIHHLHVYVRQSADYVLFTIKQYLAMREPHKKNYNYFGHQL